MGNSWKAIVVIQTLNGSLGNGTRQHSDGDKLICSVFRRMYLTLTLLESITEAKGYEKRVYSGGLRVSRSKRFLVRRLW